MIVHVVANSSRKRVCILIAREGVSCNAKEWVSGEGANLLHRFLPTSIRLLRKQHEMSTYRPGEHNDDRRGPPRGRGRDERDFDRRDRDGRDIRYDGSRSKYDQHFAMDSPLGALPAGPAAGRGRAKGSYTGRASRGGGRDDHVGSYRRDRRQIGELLASGRDVVHAELLSWEDHNDRSWRPRSRSPPPSRRRDDREHDSRHAEDRSDRERAPEASSKSLQSRLDPIPSTSSARRSASPPSRSATALAKEQPAAQSTKDLAEVEKDEGPGTPADLEPGERLDSPMPPSAPPSATAIEQPPISVSIRGSASATRDARAIAARAGAASERSGSVGMSKSTSANSGSSKGQNDKPERRPNPLEDKRADSEKSGSSASASAAAAAATARSKGVYERDNRPSRDARPGPGEGRINPLLVRNGTIREPEHTRGQNRETHARSDMSHREEGRRGWGRKGNIHDSSHWLGRRGPPGRDDRRDDRRDDDRSYHSGGRRAPADDDDDEWGIAKGKDAASAETKEKHSEMDWTTTSTSAPGNETAWGSSPQHAPSKPAGEREESKMAEDTQPPAAPAEKDAWADYKPASPAPFVRDAWASKPASPAVATSANESTAPAAKDIWEANSQQQRSPARPSGDPWAEENTQKPTFGSSPAWTSNSGADSPKRHLSAINSARQGPSPSATPLHAPQTSPSRNMSPAQPRPATPNDPWREPADPAEAAAVAAWQAHPLYKSSADIKAEEQREYQRSMQEHVNKTAHSDRIGAEKQFARQRQNEQANPKLKLIRQARERGIGAKSKAIGDIMHKVSSASSAESSHTDVLLHVGQVCNGGAGCHRRQAREACSGGP